MSAQLIPSPLWFMVPAQVPIQPSHVRLQPGQIHSHDAQPHEHQTLIMLTGQAWMTREGDPEDYVLNAGDRLTLRQAGKVVVEALDGPAEFALG
jgi:hypothetical protein